MLSCGSFRVRSPVALPAEIAAFRISERLQAKVAPLGAMSRRTGNRYAVLPVLQTWICCATCAVILATVATGRSEQMDDAIGNASLFSTRLHHIDFG